MKKRLFLLPVVLFLLSMKAFSQTVFVNQSGTTYHTKACKLYTKNFEAIPLWKAKGPYGKRPCGKCNPPTKESKAPAKKKKTAAKPKPKTTTPVKK